MSETGLAGGEVWRWLKQRELKVVKLRQSRKKETEGRWVVQSTLQSPRMGRKTVGQGPPEEDGRGLK